MRDIYRRKLNRYINQNNILKINNEIIAKKNCKNCIIKFIYQFLDTPTTTTQNGSCGNLTLEDIERRISELHKLHKNQSPAESEMNFLEHAMTKFALELACMKS